MALGADLSVPFEAKTTPVDVEEMGVLAEVFRQHPEVRVNGASSCATCDPTPGNSGSKASTTPTAVASG
jgi:hypothetical protein